MLPRIRVATVLLATALTACVELSDGVSSSSGGCTGESAITFDPGFSEDGVYDVVLEVSGGTVHCRVTLPDSTTSECSNPSTYLVFGDESDSSAPAQLVGIAWFASTSVARVTIERARDELATSLVHLEREASDDDCPRWSGVASSETGAGGSGGSRGLQG